MTTFLKMLLLLGFAQSLLANNNHVNNSGMVLIRIEAGKFTMGSPKEEKSRGKDENLTPVEITRAFFLGETEVTQGQWRSVMGTGINDLLETRSGPIGRGANLVSEASAEGANQPMVFVNWNDAMEFCKTLTQKEADSGTLPDGYHYTLPTEAQWEYACRAGTKTVFAHGDTLTSKEANFYGVKSYGVKWEGLYREKTTEVKSFTANSWGLYDMHGNVYEWCLDWYTEQAPGGKDPAIMDDGDGRNIRGGCWNRNATSCRSAYRYSSLPDRRTYNIGFRIALVKAD